MPVAVTEAVRWRTCAMRPRAKKPFCGDRGGAPQKAFTSVRTAAMRTRATFAYCGDRGRARSRSWEDKKLNCLNTSHDPRSPNSAERCTCAMPTPPVPLPMKTTTRLGVFGPGAFDGGLRIRCRERRFHVCLMIGLMMGLTLQRSKGVASAPFRARAQCEQAQKCLLRRPRPCDSRLGVTRKTIET